MKVVCFDLDDTLYKEIDFVMSAFKEVISYAFSQSYNSLLSQQDVFSEMLSAYYSGDNAFETLNNKLGLQVPVSLYLEKYRMHKPIITLSPGAAALLTSLKEKGYVVGLITDGRSVQQRNKIAALGLYQYIDNKNIVISEEIGSSKPSLFNYRYFMDLYPSAQEYIYVGDNLLKDFLTANKLSWKTICLKDNGFNIHKQCFEIDASFLPDVLVDSLQEINL